jgi:hypothetical protein
MDLAAAAKLPGVVKNLLLIFIEADNMFDLNFSFA